MKGSKGGSKNYFDQILFFSYYFRGEESESITWLTNVQQACKVRNLLEKKKKNKHKQKTEGKFYYLCQDIFYPLFR